MHMHTPIHSRKRQREQEDAVETKVKKEKEWKQDWEVSHSEPKERPGSLVALHSGGEPL